MLVYRMENRNGRGPYRSLSEPARWLRDEHGISLYDDDLHPVPPDDGVPFPPWEGSFGFASREALDRWFPKEARQLLREKGQHVTVYEVPENMVEQGRNQLVFHRDSARKVKYGFAR